MKNSPLVFPWALIGAAIVVLTGIGLTVPMLLRSKPAPPEAPPAPTPALAPTVVQVEAPPPAVNEPTVAVNAPAQVAVKAPPPRKRAAATQSAPKDDIPF